MSEFAGGIETRITAGAMAIALAAGLSACSKTVQLYERTGTSIDLTDQIVQVEGRHTLHGVLADGEQPQDFFQLDLEVCQPSREGEPIGMNRDYGKGQISYGSLCEAAKVEVADLNPDDNPGKYRMGRIFVWKSENTTGANFQLVPGKKIKQQR